MLSSTPASALTCRNDYGGFSGCAGNSTSAGDCETLGYSKTATADCEHYLYCPFDISYRRCVALNVKEPEGVCTTGALNPVCQEGFSPFKIGETEDLKMCLECQPALCSAYSPNYKTKEEYFAQTSFPIYTTSGVQLVTSPTEKSYTSCYYPCNYNMTLKSVTSTNCSIGDVLVWDRNLDKGFCTASTSKTASPCVSLEQMGVIAYKSGAKVWAIKTTGITSLAGSNTWPKGKNCQSLYQSAKKTSDYSYNTQVLLGNVSSSFASSGCRLYGGLIGSMAYGSAYKSFYYGFPNAEILGNIGKNMTAVNKTLKALGWEELQTAYACSGKVIWYDGGFSVNYGGSSGNYDYIYGTTGSISQSGFSACTPPIPANSSKAYGVMVLDSSVFAN